MHGLRALARCRVIVGTVAPARQQAVVARSNAVRQYSRSPGSGVPRRSLATEPGKVAVRFLDQDDNLIAEVQEDEGETMLEAAHRNGVDLEGACEGSLACSTCHVIVCDEDVYDGLGEPSEEEYDMLDLAFGLTETSRLGCQIKLTPEIDGIEVRLPSATRNMAVDGFKPKPH